MEEYKATELVCGTTGGGQGGVEDGERATASGETWMPSFPSRTNSGVTTNQQLLKQDLVTVQLGCRHDIVK